MVIWNGHTGWIMDRDGRVHVGVTDGSPTDFILTAHLETSAMMDLYPQAVGRASNTDSTMILLTGPRSKRR